MNQPGRSAWIRFLRGDGVRLAILAMGLISDQITKELARLHFSLSNGEPDYFKIHQVIGEWLQFRLVYNSGAAFGLKPQTYLPFLHPTLFYVLFSSVAITVLIAYYRKLGENDDWPKTGVALILSGAFGNLIDRLTLNKVTDFIDVGIPGIPTRWPTFNIADSCVCVGVALILVAPVLTRKKPATASPAAVPAAPGPDNA